MKQQIIFILFLFLLVLPVSAIKISPTIQKIQSEMYQTTCIEIWVLPEENYKIRTEWSIDGKGDLSKYNLQPDQISLIIQEKYLSNSKYEFCLNPGKSGNFSGLIYFYSEKNSVEIASWIELQVSGEISEQKKVFNAQENFQQITTKSSELKNEILTGTLIFLTGFLVLIIFYKK